MLVLCLTVLAATPCPPRQFCNTTGTVSPSSLLAATARAADDAWAVGEAGAALRWNGAEWLASVTNTADSLRSVVSSSPGDAWAAGDAMVLHWDGAWRPVPRPEGSGPVGPLVEVRPGEVWVLGQPALRAERGALVPLPDAAQALSGGGDVVLDAAACAPNDVWAIRRGADSGLVIAHWNGKATTTRRFPARANGGAVSCVGGAAWIAVDASVLRCGAGGCAWVASVDGARLLKGPRGPYLVVGTELLRWSGARLVKVADVPGRWLGGADRADDDVLLVGEGGATGRFDGQRFVTPERAALGRLRAVSVTPGGDAWVIGDAGVHSWRDGKWTRNATFSGRDGTSIWAAGPGDVWAAADGRLAHWDGGRWTAAPVGGEVRAVWGRPGGDVWALGPEGVWRGSRGQWSQVGAPRRGFRYARLAGDATSVWALAQRTEPGPQAADEVLALGEGAPRWLAAAGRVEDLAVIRGELWTTARSGTLRLVGDRWAPVPGVGGGALVVPTAAGALILTGWVKAQEWDGASVSVVTLPSRDLVAGASAGHTVWLVGRDAALRRSAP